MEKELYKALVDLYYACLDRQSADDVMIDEDVSDKMYKALKVIAKYENKDLVKPLPCPFCGKEVHPYFSPAGGVVNCDHCGYSAGISKDPTTLEGAIKDHNRIASIIANARKETGK